MVAGEAGKKGTAFTNQCSNSRSSKIIVPIYRGGDLIVLHGKYFPWKTELTGEMVARFLGKGKIRLKQAVRIKLFPWKRMQLNTKNRKYGIWSVSKNIFAQDAKTDQLLKTYYP